MRRILLGFVLFSVLLCTPALAAETAPVGELARLLQGTNPPGSTVEETPLGDMAADAVRWVSGADVAIVNGGYITANLQPGEVYEDDIVRAFSRPAPLVTVTMTRHELRQWLETGVSHIRVGKDERVDAVLSAYDGFPQIAGCSFRYDPSAPAGGRVSELETETASELLTVACTAEMADGSFGYAPRSDAVPLSYDLTSAVTAYFAGRTIEPPETGRSILVGTADNSIIRRYPALLFVLVAAGLFFLYSHSAGKKKWLDIK